MKITKSNRMACGALTACLLMLGTAAPVCAVTTNVAYGGIHTDWPSLWTPISSLNDANNGVSPGRLDFVGDALNPGAYVSTDNKYVYFRMRVAATGTTPQTWEDNIWVFVDKLGTGTTNVPDYAFAWDTKGTYIPGQNQEHGLEMQITDVAGATWNTIKMNDLDGNVAKKIAPPDFNTTGDGYLRTIDGQATTNFGTTTFIDFAVSWNYLTNQTTLGPAQSWRLQLGSRADATDHNTPTGDIAGGASPASSISFWSSPMVIPEPTTGTLLVFSGLVAWLVRRKLRR